MRTIDQVLVDNIPTFLGNGLLGARFRVRERLGFGGAGVVYLADDLLFPKRPVAIKVCCSKGAHEEQRFQDEIEVLGALCHPNLVVPFAWGRTPGGHLYLVLEYLRGQDLGARLERGPLTLRACVLLGIGVGEGLLALHGAGLLHRDVKPSNIILLDPSGIRVKLIDLGVVKKAPELWPSDGERVETATNAAPGTLPYLPPEAGRVPPDPKFDVYGLGATLFEAATGRKYRMGEALGDLPAGLREVLSAALAVNADARPTLAALVADLVRLRDAEPLLQGRYELLKPIGRGGKAEVWRAVQRLTGRDVVIKRLHERASEEDALRLRHEAQVLAALDHPAFPTLLDIFEIEGRLHLVMTLARGEQALRCTEDPLSPAQVCAVGIELLRALQALHQLGVLHRDLHAANVMIDFEGPRGRPLVTILDLGMCELLPAWWTRHLRYATPPERRAQLGSAKQETLDWSAPETMSGGWTEKSDVWSVALLLYRLLTAHMPFAPKSKTTLTCPRQFRPDCPPDLAQALLLALHPDPKSRLDAEQLLGRLDDALAMMDEEGSELDETAAPAPVAAPSIMASSAERATPHAPASPPVVPASPPVAPAPPPANPTKPSTRGWTMFMAADDSATPGVPPGPAPAAPQPVPARTPRAPTRPLRTALGLGLALLLGLAIGRSLQGPPQADIEGQAKRSVLAPVPEANEAPLLGNMGLPPRERPPPAAAEVLKAASGSLSRCAEGEALTLVAAVDASGVVTLRELFGPDSAASCVRAVLATLRAALGPGQSITLEVP